MALTCAVIMQLMQMTHSAAFFTLEVIPLIKIWAISQMIYSLNLLSNIFNTLRTKKQQLKIKKMEQPEVVAVDLVEVVAMDLAEVGPLNLR